MIRKSLILILLLAPCVLFAQENKQIVHSVFLIGDAGEPKYAPENFNFLRKELEAAGEKSTLLFLGDNIYPTGLGDKNDPERKAQEKKLTPQLDLASEYDGKVFMLPGNHDWAKGKREGWQNVLNQEAFVNEYLQNEEVYQPTGGCPGPVEFELSKGLWLVIFDMQWLLHKFDKPGEESSCEFKTSVEVMLEIDNLLDKHKNDRVILASHHPMYSYGSHGGKYPFKDHIFPLANLKKGLYIPLPVIGSIYPVYRSTIGNIQDIPHSKYKAFRNTIEGFLTKHKNAVFVAGHEHSLQHIKKDGIDYIVSGSGSKTTYVKKGKFAEFVASRRGYNRIDLYEDGSIKTEFWVADKEFPNGKMMHDAVLFGPKTSTKTESTDEGKLPEQETVKASASSQYEAGGFKRFLMGDNYRDVWAKELDIPVFDIGKEKGGLTPIKMGGGMQTKSLRMKAEDGRQYVLRSIEKYAENAMPPMLRQTIAVSIVQDQISASHPYGAFIVPYLADAAGIYHTNPKVVYIPDDPRLGEFRDKFANTLALFEERPAKNWKGTGQFGDSKKLINTMDVLESIQKDNDNKVDQQWTLKSRLFDMIIGDWDRHDDQWRWASFKEGEGKMYRPIPRDRDQAFFINQGLIPKIASRKWAVPKVEGFNDEIRWAPGLSFNARNFDRSFLSNTSREDWKRLVKELQESLTDEKIDYAVRHWPKEIYEMTGQQVASTLKSRRDNLEKPALELFEYLAKAVNVVGTNKTELFKVHSPADGQLNVVVSKISKKGNIKQEIFNRTFYSKETKEVRLYALDGNDQFDISGVANSGIKVRIISGEGDDEINQDSEVGKKVHVYDNPGTSITGNESKVKKHLTHEPGVHLYDRMDHKYDVLLPLVYWQFNRDDGLFVGGGFIYTKNGWRKKPFASKHTLTGDLAFATNAFNIKYYGIFTDVAGKWDLELQADVQEPFFVNNFFGIGNESAYDVDNRDIDYYRVRFENLLFRATLSKELGAHGKFLIGPEHRGFALEESQDNFLSDPASGFNTTDLFDTHRAYTGLYAGLQVDTRDNKQLTTRGIFWNTEIELLQSVNDYSSDFQRIQSEISFFYSAKYPARTTFAWRIGAAHNFSGFRMSEFYLANTLGGRTNLRGFRRTRFYGETSLYNNFDVRIKLFNFRSYLFPGQFGILGFYDFGRVWLTGESSDVWHDSAGAGIYVAPLGQAVISFSLAYTDEENLPVIGLGFFF